MNVRPLNEVNQQAIRLLYKELGVVDAVRFLKQFTQGYGNYTLEREVIFANKTLDEIVVEIEEQRKTAQVISLREKPTTNFRKKSDRKE